MAEKGLREQDLGEFSNYQDRIDNLKKVWEIRELRDKIVESIYQLENKKDKRNDDKQDKPVNLNKLKETFNQSQNQDGWNQEKEKLLKEIQDLKNRNNQGDLAKEVNSLKQLVQQLEKEVNQLKTEIQELKKENDNSPEYQAYLSKKEAELKNKEQKLEELRSITKNNNDFEAPPKKNDFPTGLVIGGGTVGVIMIILVVTVIKRSKRK